MVCALVRAIRRAKDSAASLFGEKKKKEKKEEKRKTVENRAEH